MINWEKELERIFADPLLADVKAPRKRATSSDRLIAGFQKITDFYEKNRRLPEDNPTEGKLYHMWIGLLSNPDNVERCRPFDDCGILPQQIQAMKEPQMEFGHAVSQEDRLEEILNDPLFTDSENEMEVDIFDIPQYMRDRLDTRREAEYIGSRRTCEDFDKYAEGFKSIHEGLKSGKYRLTKFSINNLKVGRYFVEDGIIGYLSAFENEAVDRYGTRDGRTRIIYENGSEADIKFKTLTKNLSVTGYSVQDCSDISADELERYFTLDKTDIASGTIYVLRSKSTRPEIASIKNLYKVGFTVTSVESRTANARNEPTYLCADVEVVATWKVYNVKTSTLEALIHKLFAPAQLQLTIDGHHPKEWFIVPLEIIEEAAKAIISGKTIEYNPQFQQIVYPV